MFFTSSWSPNKSTPQTAPSEWWRLSCAGYRPHGGPQPTHIPCFLRENLGKPGKTWENPLRKWEHHSKTQLENG